MIAIDPAKASIVLVHVDRPLRGLGTASALRVGGARRIQITSWRQRGRAESLSSFRPCRAGVRGKPKYAKEFMKNQNKPNQK